jgi:stage III sporulation protein AA
MEKEDGGGGMQESLLKLFPKDRQGFWSRTVREAEKIQEIRLRIGRPILIRRASGDCYLDEQGEFTEVSERGHRTGERELEEFLMHLCHDSPYAFEDELRQGFITVPGGHRVGVAGQAVLEKDGSIRTLKHIYYMNIRIAHQMFGVAQQLLPQIYQKGELSNILIISPPGCGKTTLLRELVRQISDGNDWGRGLSVGVVDERSEIAGSYLGRPRNDLGSRTDVLDSCPKALGMILLLRSMSPQVIAVDELGNSEDVAALRSAAACGSRILATVHGESPEDVAYKFPELTDRQLFNCLVVLGKREGQPVVEKVYRGEEAAFAFSGRNYDCGRMSGAGIMVSGAVYRKNPFPAHTGNDS